MSDAADQPVIYLKPVAAKRYTALAMLYVLAGILAWVAVVQPPAGLGWQIFLWVLAIGAVLMANATAKATAQGLQLRGDAIYTDAGEVLVQVADIRKIDRGVFAVKPSNGFLLRLKTKHPRGWAPGVWWRLGRVMGVGGVTSKIQAQIMAETLALLVSRQE
jgi:hypothetical protein